MSVLIACAGDCYLLRIHNSGHGNGRGDLGWILNFKEADLEANRAGQISVSQGRRLWRQEILKLVVAFVLLVGGSLSIVSYEAGWIAVSTKAKGVAVGVVLLLFGALFVWMSAVLWLDLLTGQVSTVEDEVRPHEANTGRGGPVYSLNLPGLSFRVPYAAFNEVQQRPGRRRVHYLKRSKTLLSIEPIG